MPLFSFENVFFTVGNGDKQKSIIRGISHTIERGQVVAVLGPSGSGKTTLLNILALRAGYGKAYGAITLRDKVYTGKEFKEHCFYVQQYDKNWENLSVKETLTYAAQMFGTPKGKVDDEVQEILVSIGLEAHGDTRSKTLSGGQQRRLSLAVALLKKPDVLFMDEITSGLDSVSTLRVCELLRKLADERNIGIVVTIHQPSTKVFENFDQVMILSKGRLAYAGPRNEAKEYFNNLGYPIPPFTCESEHYLDTVDADFGSEEQVEMILNKWTEKTSLEIKDRRRKSRQSAYCSKDKKYTASTTYFSTLLSRQIRLIVRDPIVYVGRMISFLLINILFTLVYWNTREMTQVQALNKAHLIMWFLACPSILAVTALVSLNAEYKSVLKEVKNGMYTIPGYIVTGLLLMVPIMIAFALAAIPIPIFAMCGFDVSHFFPATFTFALHILVYESVAEAFAVWIHDPILGMLAFLCYWVTCFLTCGVFLPARDMFWPVKAIHYVSSFGYYGRTMVNLLLSGETFNSCDISTNVLSAVCTASTDGADIVLELGKVVPVYGDVNYTRDALATAGIVIFFKLIFIAGLFVKAAKFHTPELNAKVPISERQSYAESIGKYMNGGRTSMVDDQMLSVLFKQVDKDCSGVINENEFCQFTIECKHCSISKKDARKIFSAIDIDASGTIDFPEFCAFFKSLPEAQTADTRRSRLLPNMIHKFDDIEEGQSELSEDGKK